MDHVRDRLANMAHGIQFKDLPMEVVHACKRLALDTIGCALGGSAGMPAVIVREVARAVGGTAEAGLIGGGAPTSCTMATLVNGTLLRYLDLNDYYFGLDSAHPSGNFAAGLAVAQRAGRSGRDLIAAMVAGYELHIRLCDLVAQPGISARGWHPGTNAQFASAAIAARLLGDDPVVTANAIAIAGSQNNTLAQMQRADLPMSKAVAEAQIAKGGVEAALLAKAGLTGPEEIFEGVAGWAGVVAGGLDMEALVAPPGERLRILDACIKPYGAVAGAMAPIQAAIDLREMDAVVPERIKTVTILLPAVTARKANDPKKLAPRDKETADHSVHYCVAVALLDGACGPGQFTPQRIAARDVAAMIGRTTIAVDATLTALWPAAGGGVQLVLEDGVVVSRMHRQPPGHPDNPMSDAGLERKFLELADGVIPVAQAHHALDRIWTLERCERIDELMALLTPLV